MNFFWGGDDWLIRIQPFYLTNNAITYNNVVVFLDDASVEVNWDSTLEEATVTWSGVFTSTHPLYYEVSVGHSAGSVDIIQWQETRSEQLKFTLDADTVGQFGVEIYAVVRAISPSGTYATAFAQTLLT